MAKRKRHWVTWASGKQEILERESSLDRAVLRAHAVARRIKREVRVGVGDKTLSTIIGR